MKKRIIARLDIKKDKLIKGIHLEGLRVVGDPIERALKYYMDGVDELLLVDAVASLYGRNSLVDVVKEICKDIFIPITIGGGISSLRSAYELFEAGADKICINTAAVNQPSLIKSISSRFGEQAVVLSVQAKRCLDNGGSWSVMTDNGREKSSKNIFDWLRQAQDLGIGEILITSIDMEGTGLGFDLDLLERVLSITSVPVQISGGFSRTVHAHEAFEKGAQAVVIAQALHYEKISMCSLRCGLSDVGIQLRTH